MAKEKKICHVDSPKDGPMDGVRMKTDCIRTDFLENPSEGEAVFQQRGKSESSISASMEIGVFSIRDMQMGVMLTVSLQDAMEVMASAMEAAREEEKCTEKTLEHVETAENVSDLLE